MTYEERPISFGDMLADLEHLLKIMFYKHPNLSPGSEALVKKLLESKLREFQKLGVYSLYCLALALSEK